LRDVGNVTEMATFVTTHLADGKSTSVGKGNFTTSDGDTANYTGQDVGIQIVMELKHTKVSRFLVAVQKVSLDSQIM